MRDSAAHGPNTLAPAPRAVNDPEPTWGMPPWPHAFTAIMTSAGYEARPDRGHAVPSRPYHRPDGEAPGRTVGTVGPCPPYGFARPSGFMPARVTTDCIRRAHTSGVVYPRPRRLPTARCRVILSAPRPDAVLRHAPPRGVRGMGRDVRVPGNQGGAPDVFPSRCGFSFNDTSSKANPSCLMTFRQP